MAPTTARQQSQLAGDGGHSALGPTWPSPRTPAHRTLSGDRIRRKHTHSSQVFCKQGHGCRTSWTPERSFFNPVTVWYRILNPEGKRKTRVSIKPDNDKHTAQPGRGPDPTCHATEGGTMPPREWAQPRQDGRHPQAGQAHRPTNSETFTSKVF